VDEESTTAYLTNQHPAARIFVHDEHRKRLIFSPPSFFVRIRSFLLLRSLHEKLKEESKPAINQAQRIYLE